MRIIGFNFTKVSAERSIGKTMGKDRSTNIEFENIEEEEESNLGKDDSKILKASFKFSINYEEKDKKDTSSAEVTLTGIIILMATKEEAKDIQKAWEKKELPASFRIPIFNFILRKCSIRALQLEDELNLPLHLPMPRLDIEKSNEKKEN